MATTQKFVIEPGQTWRLTFGNRELREVAEVDLDRRIVRWSKPDRFDTDASLLSLLANGTYELVKEAA